MRAAATRRVVLVAMIPLVLAGCAVTQNVQQIEALESDGENPTVLLMPPDIRYYLVTAGGVPEPHAEWTAAARQNFSVAVQEFAGEIGTELKVLDDGDMTPLEIQYRKLHEAVGYSVMMHHFGATKLPSKEGAFDWSLGPGINEIAEEHDADYALFAFYRDQQASGGRVALAILAAAATGAYIDGNREYGFASLVDLRTGEIVWFNVVSAGTGELRDAEGATTAVNVLFRDMPVSQAP
jgi:hypothetical protein